MNLLRHVSLVVHPVAVVTYVWTFFYLLVISGLPALLLYLILLLYFIPSLRFSDLQVCCLDVRVG